jgi:cellulose synthase/poly-beta-1,6-N-acetylglucosamine synthase-like glycosyltransferase
MTKANFRAPEFDQFCVVIPAFNEALLVGRCIESVIKAGVPARHIYVVDDASQDGTAVVARQFAGVNVLVNESKRGKLGGIRHALEHFDLAARYHYLAILDADSHVAPGYFIEIFNCFARDEHTVLACGAPHSERYNWLTAYRAYEYAVTLRLYREGQHALGVITVAPGCASVYRTRILDQLDWDACTLVEDMDLTVQIHRRKLGRVVYTRHAIAYTQDPRTLREYIGQLTRWYRGTWQVVRLRRVPFGGQRIDAEFAMLLGEGLFFSLATVCAPLLAFLWPTAVLTWFAIDLAMVAAFSVACAVGLKRADVLVTIGLFTFLRFVNCAVLLRSFWLEIVRNQQALDWFSVARYSGAAMEKSNA